VLPSRAESLPHKPVLPFPAVYFDREKRLT
jgi:hypothetical protein